MSFVGLMRRTSMDSGGGSSSSKHGDSQGEDDGKSGAERKTQPGVEGGYSAPLHLSDRNAGSFPPAPAAMAAAPFLPASSSLSLSSPLSLPSSVLLRRSVSGREERLAAAAAPPLPDWRSVALRGRGDGQRGQLLDRRRKVRQRRRLSRASDATAMLIDSEEQQPDADSEDEHKQLAPSAAAASSSFPLSPWAAAPLPPSLSVRVSVSGPSPDYSPILSMGYSLRQAVYASRLFNDDVEQALVFLIDMDDHRDELEIQIVQAELEDEERERAAEEDRKRRQQSVTPKAASWLRLFPRFSPTASSSSSQAGSRAASSASPHPAKDLERAASEPSARPPAASSLLSSSALSSPLPSPLPSELDDSPIPGDDFPLHSPLSRVPPHPAPVSPPPAPESPFACSACTFINDCAPWEACAMCGSERTAWPAQQAWRQSLRQCGICFDSFPAASLCTAAAACGHLFCWSCFYHFLVSRVDESRVLELRCPQPGCQRPVLDAEAKLVLDAHQYARYRRFKRAAQLAADPRVRYCPNRSCQRVLRGSAAQPRMLCSACGLQSCYTCSIPWHDGLSCLQVLRHTQLRGPSADDVAFLQLMHAQQETGSSSGGSGGSAAVNTYRQCPTCGVWVERSAGCAKMTCRCGSQWCFQCGSAGAQCGCTPRFHVFYPLHTVLSNWNNAGPG